jgi:hypothetical protein
MKHTCLIFFFIINFLCFLSCNSNKEQESKQIIKNKISTKNQYSDTVWIKNDSQRFLLKILTILPDSAMGHSWEWVIKERTQLVDEGLKNGYLINNDEIILHRKFKSVNNFYTTVNDGTWEFSIFEFEKEKCIIVTHGTAGDGDEFFAFEYDKSKLTAIPINEVMPNSVEFFFKEGLFKNCNQTLKNNDNNSVWSGYSFLENKIIVKYEFDEIEEGCLKGNRLDLNFNKKTKRFDIGKIYWEKENDN